MQFHVLPANFILAKINMLPSELLLSLLDVSLGQNSSINVHGLAMNKAELNHFVTQILLTVVANVSFNARICLTEIKIRAVGSWQN